MICNLKFIYMMGLSTAKFLPAGDGCQRHAQRCRGPYSLAPGRRPGQRGCCTLDCSWKFFSDLSSMLIIALLLTRNGSQNPRQSCCSLAAAPTRMPGTERAKESEPTNPSPVDWGWLGCVARLSLGIFSLGCWGLEDREGRTPLHLALDGTNTAVVKAGLSLWRSV